MAIGKNNWSSKGGGRKGAKKKQVDPFSKKEWYKIQVPAIFEERTVGRTIVTKSSGTKLASDGLKGRVYEISLGDLKQPVTAGHPFGQSYKKFRFICDEVQSNTCLTSFYGMNLTTDKLRSMVKKWQTLIEGNVDVVTSDGFHIRLFAIGFTKRNEKQTKKTTYAKHSSVKKIRAKMVEVIKKETENTSLSDVVLKLIAGSIGTSIEKQCIFTFPLNDVCIRKVKVLKRPKFDTLKLNEAHSNKEERKQRQQAAAPVPPTGGEEMMTEA
ncbi:hypothetical protein SNEBB_000575 [Seison nebaliae]|nr:hypothetical protein SNEBB_000575 [Seison nebaliae]